MSRPGEESVAGRAELERKLSASRDAAARRDRAQFSAEPSAESARPQGPTASPTGSETILLVEDEDALRAAAERILTGAGYRVVAAANGAEALAAAQSLDGQIDLLLTDVVMPGMLGHRLAEQLLALRPSLRIMYMSGFAEPVVRESMSPEIGGLIEKPFSSSTLLARVRGALG